MTNQIKLQIIHCLIMDKIMKRSFYIILFVAPLLISGKSVSPGQLAANKYNGVVTEKPITIYQNYQDGKYLKLSNGETWEVYQKDTDHSGGWIGGELVIKKQDQYRRSGQKYYRYKIYNKATNDFVWARLSSKADN